MPNWAAGWSRSVSGLPGAVNAEVPEHWLPPTREIAGSSFFVFGFEKNERANIADDELEALQSIAKELLVRSGPELDHAVDDATLEEICHDKKR